MSDYSTTDTVVRDDTDSETRSEPSNTELAARDDKPFSEYTEADWQAWDDSHPGELWIAYSDFSGTHRVPVWYYQTLGL